MSNEVIAPDVTIDITAETCPMTYVRARLALDRMLPGQVLAVRLRGGDAARNVPANARRQGHAVLREAPLGGDDVLVVIRRGG